MKRWVLFLGTVLALSFPACAQSAPDTVWRIGIFDGSSAEFSQEEPRQAVNFEVGRDTPKTGWYAFAPVASATKQADKTTAPRNVIFSITGQPQRAYRLKISVLIEHSSVPVLRLCVNGRTGEFYLHPKLDYSMGDTSAAFDPTYARADVEVDIPGAWLKSGENTLSLQSVSEADEHVPDAGFNYDAIELQSAHPEGPAVGVQVEPTIFYQKDGASLDERVDLFVRYGRRPHGARVQMGIGGHTFVKQLHGEQDFGEERISFNVPEFSAGTRARVSVRMNGHSIQLNPVLQPQKKWTILLVPHVHLDVGYTDYQAKVSAIQSRILDEAMDLTAKHPGFKFSTDGEWNLEQFLQSRTAKEQDRILEAIQQKQIYIPAQKCNLLTGFPTAETLIRSLYPSAEFSRIQGRLLITRT